MQRRTRFRKRLRSGLSRIEVLVLVGVIGFLISMISPAVSRAPRGTAHRLQCQSHLKQLALAVSSYALANNGRIPLLEDGQFGWPVSLLPYLDDAALYRALKANPLGVEKEWQSSKTPLLRKVLTCPADLANEKKHVGLSYSANAGWGRFLAESKTDAVHESHPHSADVDWNHDGNVTEDERLLARATGLFWRVHEDRFQLTFEDITEGDGQTTTMMFTENTNARNWLSRETFDIGFVVGLDRIKFESRQDGGLGLKLTSANLGSFAIQYKPRVLPGRSPVPSSNHSHGCNVAFADGRVESMNFNIDPRVYLARMTWNGSRHGEDPTRSD